VGTAGPKGEGKKGKKKKERDWAESERPGKDRSGPGPCVRGREGRLAFLGLGEN